MQSDIVQQLNYIAAVLEANKNKFTVPDHIPAKIKTVRETAAEITRLTEALRAAEEREKALREALGFIEAKAANFIQAVDRYNEEHGEFIGGAPIFQLAKAVGVARQALAGAKP